MPNTRRGTIVQRLFIEALHFFQKCLYITQLLSCQLMNLEMSAITHCRISRWLPLMHSISWHAIYRPRALDFFQLKPGKKMQKADFHRRCLLVSSELKNIKSPNISLVLSVQWGSEGGGGKMVE